MNLEQLGQAVKLSNASQKNDESVVTKFNVSKEENVSAFSQKDSGIINNQKPSPVSDNPFGAGVNESTNLQGVVAKKFTSMSDKLDANHDGFVTRKELVNKFEDNSVKGDDAALIGALLKNQGKIEKLSKDEKIYDLKGITRKDLAAYDKLPDTDKLKSKVDNEYYYNSSKIYSSGNVQDSHGKLQLPTKASEVNYKDLIQGSTGDCYFLAGLASLAQRHPQKIVDMIHDNNNGTYTVKFAEKSVTVNAPSDTKRGLYAEGKNWVPIIEEAYSVYRNEKRPVGKLNPYDTIGGGSRIVGRAIKELTGNSYDTDLMLITPKNTLREKLNQANQDNKLMVASINKKLVGKDLLGLPDGHVYTVLNYNKSTDQVTIRNPWGETETQDSNGVPKDGVDDGIFELSLDDFHKHFSEIAIEK